jgi:hypothetical protein
VKLLFVLLLLAPLGRAQSCTPPEMMRPEDSIKSALSDTSCRLTDGTRYAEYALIVPVNGELQLGAAAPDFEIKLLLRDASGRKLDAGPNIRRTVERGRYSVLVNSTRNASGEFTLTSAFTPEPRMLCRDLTPIGPNQSVAGRLTASSCRLPDNSAFDHYAVSFFGWGTLEIVMEAADFTPYLILRTDEGRQLAFDTKARSAKIVYTVKGDESYTIVAAAGDSAGAGQYRLTLSFKPADEETCRALKTLVNSEDLQGKISAESCRIKSPPSQPLWFNYYDVKLAEAGLVDLRASSSTFDPVLILLDASGAAVDFDALSGGKGKPVLRRQLQPGSYTVVVYSSSGTGDYNLQYKFRAGPPETCPVLSLEAAATASGSLSGASSCRTQAGPADVYRIALPSPGTLDILMSSGDFPTWLLLRDEKDNPVTGISGAPNSRLVLDVPAGTWTVAAGTAGLPGAYSIAYQFTPRELPACSSVQKIEPNSAFLARLTDASCRGADGQPVDFYEFTASADSTVAAVMTSSDFDGLLTLETTQGNVLRRDDNSYGRFDALIVQYLAAGTYRLGAHSSRPNSGGLYRVDVLSAAGDRPPGCVPLRSLAFGDKIEGQLSFASCQYPGDTFAGIYRLDVAELSQVDIRLNSSQFDAFLLIIDAKGNLVDLDDDSGGNTNARLIRSLEAGAYYLVARPYAGYSSVGAYILSVDGARVPPPETP